MLAFACAFTMFAGAAFTDQADIKVDSEVVDTLVSLGVIDGFADGSFKPNDTVTRAQMAKMIYVLRTGNSDASAYNDDKTSFTDIGSHWARGYIKYCQSLGIIAGKSNTIFAPNATVTAQEAAKMLLVTLGYDAQKAGLVGAGWASKTNALADENGLLDDVTTSFTGPCPRQYAAQLIYNAIDAPTVVLRDGEYTNMKLVTGIYGQNDYNPTIGEKYMGLTKATGILYYVKEDNKGTYSLNLVEQISTGAKSSKWDPAKEDKFTKVKKDYTDLLGQEVQVLYKDSDDVFGVYSTDKNEVVVETTAGLIDSLKTVDKTFEVNGTKYKYDSNFVVYKANNTTADSTNVATIVSDESAHAYAPAYAVNLVSMNDDDKIDYAVVIPTTVAKVTYAGSKSITLNNSIGSIDTEDVDTYEGLKKDDWVLYTAEADGTAYNATVEKLEPDTGTVESAKDNTEKEIKIDGVWYKRAAGSAKAGDKVTAVVYGGYYYDIDKNAGSASADDVLFVYEAGKLNNGVTTTGVEASVLFADGTTQTVRVEKMVNPANDNEYTVDASNIKTVNDNNASTLYTSFNNNKANIVVGAMYTYEKDGAKYKLTPLSDTDNKCGYDNFANLNASLDGDGFAYFGDNGNNRLAGARVDDDAVIFVAKNLNTNTTGADAKVITGKALKAWSAHVGSSSMALTDSKNGVATAKVGTLTIKADNYGSEAGHYGVIVDDPAYEKINGTNYVALKTWTEGATENTTFLVKGTNTGAYRKGNAFKYDTDDTETVGDVTYTVIKNVTQIPTLANSAEVAVLGAEKSGSDILVDVLAANTNGSSQTFKVNSDTTVIYIDGKKGAQAIDLTDVEANESAVAGYYVSNAWIVKNADNTLDLIVIDVANELNTTGDLELKGTTSYIDSINGDVITLKPSASGTTIANLISDLKNVQTTATGAVAGSSSSDGSITIVATNGSAKKFTVKCPGSSTFTAQ